LGPRLGEVAAQIGHPDPDLQRGREGAAGDDAGRLAHRPPRVSLTGNARTLDLEGDQLLRGALGAGLGDRLGADETGRLLAAPAEPGLDRVALGREVVAMQGEAGL